jgi:FdhD protein
MKVCHRPNVASVSVVRVIDSIALSGSDDLSVEEPLEIHVVEHRPGATPASAAVTMRTPGDDVDLVAGFLLTAEIIAAGKELETVERAGPNAVLARLQPGVALDRTKLERHSFVSSSCSAFGKRSIDAIRVLARHALEAGKPRVDPSVIHCLPHALRFHQSDFARTGGTHASGLFDSSGQLRRLREDVSQQNALDKLIGAELRANRVPLSNHLLLVSCSLSFELVRKAAIAGISVLAAVGAPSSLAVALARECGMTLLGFVRDGRFNIYSDFGRIKESADTPHQVRKRQHAAISPLDATAVYAPESLRSHGALST